MAIAAWVERESSALALRNYLSVEEDLIGSCLILPCASETRGSQIDATGLWPANPINTELESNPVVVA
jgi:hypothetical protein